MQIPAWFQPALALCIFAATAPAQPATFETASEQPSSSFLSASSVSADGSVVFFTIHDNATPSLRAMVWSGSTITRLPTLNSTADASQAMTMSQDGHTFIAACYPGGYYRWRSETGAVPFSSLGMALVLNTFAGISSDGSTLYGTYTSAAPSRAWVWSQATGVRYLPDLPGGGVLLGSLALVLSADGHTIFGSGGLTSTYPAVEWRDAQAPTFLIDADFLAVPMATSADGSIVTASLNGRDCRIRAGQIQFLYGSDMPGMQNSTSMSGDGVRVIGSRAGSFPSIIALWDPFNGARELTDALTHMGLSLGPWSLRSALISADGRTIAGIADTASTTAVYRVHLPPASCYANCDGSDIYPALNINDFLCFLNKFVAADPYANCDGSTQPPILNAGDFQCFLNKFAAGCP